MHASGGGAGVFMGAEAEAGAGGNALVVVDGAAERELFRGAEPGAEEVLA